MFGKLIIILTLSVVSLFFPIDNDSIVFSAGLDLFGAQYWEIINIKINGDIDAKNSNGINLQDIGAKNIDARNANNFNLSGAYVGGDILAEITKSDNTEINQNIASNTIGGSLNASIFNINDNAENKSASIIGNKIKDIAIYILAGITIIIIGDIGSRWLRTNIKRLKRRFIK